jgi:hypothetical protein
MVRCDACIGCVLEANPSDDFQSDGTITMHDSDEALCYEERPFDFVTYAESAQDKVLFHHYVWIR